MVVTIHMAAIIAMENKYIPSQPPLVDFHAHILPGVDHGSRNLSTSLEQLNLAEKYGIKTIVATSHFYANQRTVADFIDLRNRAYRHLSENRTSAAVRILLGAEVLLSPKLHRMSGIEQLCVEGSDNLLLLELPMGVVSDAILETIYALKARGFQPLMAHLDRYRPIEVEKVFALGVKTQLNADAFSHFFTRRWATKLIKTDTVYALGSDIHGAAPKSYAAFSKALRHLGAKGEILMERANLLIHNR